MCSSALLQPASGSVQPGVNAQSAQPQQSPLAAQSSEATLSDSAEGKKTDQSPAGSVGGPKGASPGVKEGLSPSKQVKMMTGILEVLAREVLNPASSKETRDAAHSCLQVCKLLTYCKCILYYGPMK